MKSFKRVPRSLFPQGVFPWIVILLLLAAPFGLGALEITQGVLKLELHEDLGRYTLYYLSDVEKESYTALIDDEDPRTSKVTVYDNNSLIHLGNLGGYRMDARETATGALYQWESKEKKIVQRFDFVKAEGSSVTNGVLMTLSITNLSESIWETGVRILWDTYLGEDKTHFRYKEGNGTEEINKEYRLEPPSFPQYWLSQEREDKTGFMAMLTGERVTRPEAVYFANWKRLDDSSWDYSYRENRNFNMLPYFFNDSAVAHYYPRRKLQQGETYQVKVLMGASDGSDIWTGGSGDDELTPLYEETREVTIPADMRQAINQDILSLKDLITRIDYYMKNPDEISREELRALRRVYSEILKKKEKYKE